MTLNEASSRDQHQLHATEKGNAAATSSHSPILSTMKTDRKIASSACEQKKCDVQAKNGRQMSVFDVRLCDLPDKRPACGQTFFWAHDFLQRSFVGFLQFADNYYSRTTKAFISFILESSGTTSFVVNIVENWPFHHLCSSMRCP